jgi:hypothetical protein
MTATVLDRFVGMSLMSVASSTDDLILAFDRGTLIAFNRYSLPSPPPIGEQVQSVQFKEQEALCLLFASGHSFELSLVSLDYTGPDAFCATFEDGTIVVE